VRTEHEYRSSSATPPTHSGESYTEDESDSSYAVHMKDLTLMHQWSVATCYEFGDTFQEETDLWRHQTPILAQQFPSLMHGTLAFSALHLAKTSMDPNSRDRYLRTAAAYQDLALIEYRCMLLNVTKETAVAVMAFSAMLTVYSFAAPQNPCRAFAEGTFGWIVLHRAAADMAVDWELYIDNSLLARQMHRRMLQPVDPLLDPEDYRLHCLEALIAFLPCEEANKAPAYKGALYWLRRAYAHTYCNESMLGANYAVLYWIERVPPGFIDLIGLQ
jgi:hypothetical protein